MNSWNLSLLQYLVPHVSLHSRLLLHIVLYARWSIGSIVLGVTVRIRISAYQNTLFHE